MRQLFRPIPCARSRPGARSLAGGLFGFAELDVHGADRTDGTIERLPADAVPALYPDAAGAICAMSVPRLPVLGLAMDRPRIMGVVNVTPDSFSDGGTLVGPEAAVSHGLALAEAGADILDIGGESTRPRAAPVSPAEELDRVVPVIEGLVAAGCMQPISIDTRNAVVARAALAAGASMFNDVSALTHDPDSLAVARDMPALCLMHAAGDPRTMQENPQYDDVVAEVFDYLAGRIAVCEAAGIPRARIVVDPGIGFGKTISHNMALIRNLSVFHALGCAVLLGVSRKGFIGKITGEPIAARRGPGSIAAGLAGLGQGVQILRVHDVAETVQAVRMWEALQEGRS